MRFVISGILAALFLGGCDSFPRGAGLQSEVLAEVARPADADPGTPVPASFAVEPVTRDSLARIAAWPLPGPAVLPWIDRVAQPANRLIAAGDSLSVTVWNTEESGLLTGLGQRFVTLPDLRVAPGGTIFLPYLGDLRVAGMSPDRARARIEEGYLDVMPSAQVQLTLAEGRANTVALVSGVAAPGVYPLADTAVSLLELIAQGGGVAAGLNNPQVRLQRGTQTYGISLDRLLADTARNTTLAGGDRVFVRADDRHFLSLGAAGTEARHAFPRDHVTALDALSIIGGLAEMRADARGILILRRYPARSLRADGSGPPHERTIFTIDLTSADGLFSAGQFRIAPEDLIYVTESPLLNTRTVFGLIGSVFSLANQLPE